MSGWFGSMGTAHNGRLGHPHMTDGDFFRAHDMAQEDPGATINKLHPMQYDKMSEAGKKAAMGLVVGALVGGVLLQVGPYKKMMTKQKSWQAAAIGAAVAVPLISVSGSWAPSRKGM